MRLFSKKKIEKELALVFDIGSSSIGGAIFEINKNGVPKIIFSIRESITLENEMDGERFLLLTLKALDIVASKVSLAGVGNPSRVFCVLSSPWYASQTRVIKLEKNVPFIFNSKLADSLIQKEIGLFEKEHLSKFADTNDKMRMIEFKNMKTILNGYATSLPYNKKCKKLEMVIFVSMSSDKVLKKIEEKIHKHFHNRDVRFYSFAIASFALVRDMFQEQKDFLLIDICGEVTDISLVKKDALMNSISFPLGRNFMIRKMAGKLNYSLDEARSYISLYKDGHLSSNLEKKIAPVINKIKIEWLNEFQKSLINISEKSSIPSDVFITVDQDFASFFGDIIKNEEYNQYTLTHSKFKIMFLNTQTFHKTADFQNDTNRDPFLIIESLFINRFIC